MKYALMTLMSFALAFQAQANPVRETITCTNDHYQLVLNETAVPTFKTATLSFSDRHIAMKCQGEIKNGAPGISFTCVEDRAGDGRYLAGVVVMDHKGTAEVVHEQMYPLQPKKLATLECQI